MRSFDIVNTELVIMELLMLAAPLILLVLLYLLVRNAVSGVRDAAGSGGSSGGGAGVSASEVLNRRYANGELTREEYLTIRDDMTRGQNA